MSVLVEDKTCGPTLGKRLLIKGFVRLVKLESSSFLRFVGAGETGEGRRKGRNVAIG